MMALAAILCVAVVVAIGCRTEPQVIAVPATPLRNNTLLVFYTGWVVYIQHQPAFPVDQTQVMVWPTAQLNSTTAPFSGNLTVSGFLLFTS